MTQSVARDSATCSVTVLFPYLLQRVMSQISRQTLYTGSKPLVLILLCLSTLALLTLSPCHLISCPETHRSLLHHGAP
jgi:hypothetical protein